jgi:hypothetical protein
MLRGKQPRLSIKVFKLLISEKGIVLLIQFIGRLGSSHPLKKSSQIIFIIINILIPKMYED